MDEEQARRALERLEQKYDPEQIKWSNGMTWVEYHHDRIRRESGKAWDKDLASERVKELESLLAEKDA